MMGLMRLTRIVMQQNPDMLDFSALTALVVPQVPPELLEDKTFLATPDRVWQTTGLASGHARRAIMYLVTNSTGNKERSRDKNDYPPGFGGIDGPDGYYVQHLLSGLPKLEEHLLNLTLHPDILIVHSADVDGPRLALEVAKYTKSAVVAAPIDFSRTAPGYENAKGGITTCWSVDWGLYYLNMNYAFIHSMWSLPVFKRYDLVLRIDTDLWLNSCLCYST
jgi:hypothetical protein